MSALRILVVDDEPQILRALQTSLRAAGYEVESAGDAAGALAAAAAHPPDAIILDLVLPDGTGTEVARRLREWTNVPILLLSVVGDDHEKVAALDAGADDYVTKPFSVDELLARLRAALRRSSPSAEPVLEVGELRMDLEKRAVWFSGKPVSLTRTEYDLLRVLAQSPGKLFTHPALLREVWGPGVRAGVALPPRLRLAAPPQDRAGSGAAALPADGARGRLPAGGRYSSWYGTLVRITRGSNRSSRFR